MGKIVYLNKVREFAKKTPVFRVRDIELIVKDRNYTHLILHKLTEKKEIKRIMRGWYSLYDDPIVSVFCFKPAYLGLQEALSMHNLWEQETNVVIVTTRKVRTGIRKFFGSNVIVHRIEQKYFFGFDLMRYENFFVPVSDVEKTFIDLIYFDEIPARPVLKEIKKKMSKEKLGEYLENYSSRFREKVEKLMREI
jgi:predicted transcriptional regulator of viral defense system